MRAISRPCRDCPYVFLPSRQFLPGYFHSPLPGLVRASQQGIAILQIANNLKSFSISWNAFVR
jgi:hypothetical protein